ncbi:restriction endonuclease subunit S [Heyndrickxia faecalis]|uniref:restriction endonuclease subunit S n=1 Tax=Heyndrickxia faecalis TaxID=2824910 RepID=UPI003D19DB98
MEQKNLVPKRRFKEFQNASAWEQRAVSELADRYDNFRIPITASNRVAGSTPYYGANGIQDYVEGFTHDGEFILVAEDGANDLQNYPVHYVNGKVWVNNHAHVLQAKSEIADNKFLMNAMKYMNIEPYLVGGGRSKLNADVMMKISFRVPELAEQKLIGSFFASLDHLITLHQRKLEKMKALKSAYLSEMFPAEGERVPKRRFAGFTQAWEQRKLGEMMEVTSVKRIHQSDWTDEGVRFLRARDIVCASKGEEPTDYLYISQEKYDEYSRISGKVKVGDLLVTGVGTIGVPLLVTQEEPLYFKDGNIIWFKNEKKLDGNFFYYSFIGESIQKYIRDVAGIGTVGTYTIDSGKKTPIQIPSYEEQEKIGNFFKQLDHLITLHQRKLKKLQNIKKAYLNEMFV